jgi:hypothetical protein
MSETTDTESELTYLKYHSCGKCYCLNIGISSEVDNPIKDRANMFRVCIKPF